MKVNTRSERMELREMLRVARGVEITARTAIGKEVRTLATVRTSPTHREVRRVGHGA